LVSLPWNVNVFYKDAFEVFRGGHEPHQKVDEPEAPFVETQLRAHLRGLL